MDTRTPSRDLPQILFSIILILTLLGCAIWLLHPFLLSVVWAGLIVIATWPLFVALQHKFGERRGVALVVMMIFLTVAFLIPMIFSASMLTLVLKRALQWLVHLDSKTLPTFDFLLKVPHVGERLHAKWLSVTALNHHALFVTLKPWAVKLMMVMIHELAQFGALFINGLLMLGACLIFFLHGKKIARGLRQFGFRIARERGDHAILLAGKTIQAVAMGVVLTAVIQAAFAGLGLVVCQIPSSALLTAIIFVLCLMQLGPVVIMLPAVCWLFFTGQHWSGVLLVVWMVIAGSLDNVLKPILIKRGADTSLLLIMTGVIGGMVTWGMIGLMIGPVLLAVSWALLTTWVNEAGFSPVTLTKDLL